MSILLTIYSDLEEMGVTYLDKDNAAITPLVYGLDAIPASVQTASLPCRILLPVGQGQSGTTTATVLRGAGINCQWTITDLFLLETAARSEGIRIQAPVLIRYVSAYAEAIAKKWQFVNGYNSTSLTLTVSMLPGMYEYPAGSGAFFYGCKCDLTIEEIL